MRSARPAGTPTMFPTPAEVSTIRAGITIVTNVYVDAPAAPLGDLCCRWTPTVATFDVTINDIRAHALFPFYSACLFKRCFSTEGPRIRSGGMRFQRRHVGSWRIGLISGAVENSLNAGRETNKRYPLLFGGLLFLGTFKLGNQKLSPTEVRTVDGRIPRVGLLKTFDR